VDPSDRRKKYKATAITGDPLMSLTEKQRLFVDCIVQGQTQTTAARSAGFKSPKVEGARLLSEPRIQQAVQHLYRKHEKAVDMSRSRVMEGFLDAIEMAKVQGDPDTLVKGWREIGRMCGYYAPEKHQIDVNITAKRAVDKLETLSDTELLQMIEEDSDIIEGEATEVLEEADAARAAADE